MAGEMRIDAALFQRGLTGSRTAAQRAIEEGRVFIGDRKITKPSEKVCDTAEIRLIEKDEEFVSRGAYKLVGALDTFHIDPAGLVCADIGASTGGFTQVLLRRGAKRIYAIDVGVNQLAEELRSDARVISMENCNARVLQAGSIPEQIDLIVYDVSFISATLLLDAMIAIGKPDLCIIGLIKPQFEAGRHAVGKNGIVKRAADHENAIFRCKDSAKERGLNMSKIAVSPIRGGDGNIEYLCMLVKDGESVTDEEIRKCVRLAHSK